MKLIVHVGPHKTATTAIQEMLSHNRRVLQSAGICYPVSLTRRAGQHELPWSFQGWNLRLLGATQSDVSPTTILESYLEEATAIRAHTLLLSSEDFSLLSRSGWKEFLNVICDAFARANSPLDTVVLTWSKRSISQLVASSYSTLVRLGMTFDFESVKGPLALHFRKFYRRARGVRGIPGMKLEKIAVRWRRERFLERWVKDVLPEVSVSKLSISEMPSNSRDPLSLAEALARDNIDRGVVFDVAALMSWGAYHDEESIDTQRRARESFFRTYEP
jgi:hypothetical protein